MAGPSLYWHDYETFGIDPRRDRPAQFAGIRTDLDLNPVGDPLVLYCRPADDRLPAPEACLVTGITPQEARAKGAPEACFIAAIHEELSLPETCGLGYNTLRFDDEFTRNALYRNFFDPYEREWRNGCSRWDIIDMVRLTAALRPEGIAWPKDEQGRPSFRLEMLTAANGIAHVGAHDALADVHATIQLAQLVKARQPRLYDFLWRHRGKREAESLLQLGAREPVLHASEKYPAERGCVAVAVAVARHPRNRNEIAVYDLSVDPAPLLESDAREIHRRLYTRAADLPDGVERIPLKTVHLNRCPVIAPCKTLRPADAERLGIDPARAQRHLRAIRCADALAAKLEEAFAMPPEQAQENRDPDLAIYSGGFFGDADKRTMARVRATSPERLAEIRPRFDDPRLPEMLFRYRARNWPETLNEEERARWARCKRERLTTPDASGVSPMQDYERRLNELEARPEATPRDREILSNLRDWGREIDDRRS
jgi:exodeoxyribonuclease-1